jgi:4-hydroxybenzoate polyprenyltransferase
LGGERVGGRDGQGGLARTLALFGASHPEPAATVTLGAGVLALGAGRGLGTLLVLAAVGSGQLAVGWSNDYLDRDLDRTVGRRDKPVAAGRVSARAVGLATLVALVACVPLSLASGVASGLVHLAAVACALAYNAGLKARPISVLPYAVAFGLLPAVVTLGLPAPRWPPAWVLAAGALIGSGAHFTQVLPDIPSDRALGITGLPQLIGQRAATVAAALLLGTATVVLTFGPGRPGPLQLAGLAIAAPLTVSILVAAARGQTRAAFRLTLAVAAVAVLGFLAGGRSL